MLQFEFSFSTIAISLYLPSYIMRISFQHQFCADSLMSTVIAVRLVQRAAVRNFLTRSVPQAPSVRGVRVFNRPVHKLAAPEYRSVLFNSLPFLRTRSVSSAFVGTVFAGLAFSAYSGAKSRVSVASGDNMANSIVSVGSN